MLILDLDNPANPKIELYVNGQISHMSVDEFQKFALDVEWAKISLSNLKYTEKIMQYYSKPTENKLDEVA